jgi:heme exporter protein C
VNSRSHALPAFALVSVTLALALVFFYAPTEAVQGNIQRILYLHVPSAWIAYLAFIVVAIASILVLARRADWQRFDRMASASAELGVVFTTIVLTTGPIWGHRVWGAWWVWDARLTSTLVLWLIYVGYLVFRAMSPPGERRARLSAVVGVVGAVDIPVVHFAVNWWRTLHPGAIAPMPGGSTIPASMTITLLVSLVAFTALFAVLLVVRIRLAEASDRMDAIETLEPARV